MSSQQAQGDHHVGFTATHRLGELEYRLVGFSGDSQHALSKELLHAVRNEIPGEELAAIPLIVDQIRQVLDTLAHPELAGEFQVFANPTLLVFFEGKEYIRKSKYVSLPELEKEIGRLYNLVFEQE